MEILLWWLTVLVILFLFFGGLASIIIAYIFYVIGKGSGTVLLVGFLVSGTLSYWVCRHAFKWVQLSLIDTASAVVIALITFVITVRLLRGCSL
jgi:hypothetical protein